MWCPRLPLQSEARALGRLPVQDTDEQQKYVTLSTLTCWEDTPTSATVTNSGAQLGHQPGAHLSDDQRVQCTTGRSDGDKKEGHREPHVTDVESSSLPVVLDACGLVH